MNLGDESLPELPFDVVSEIIIRLPVKSLCRFKCVAKPWLFLISNSSFAKKHLDLSKRNQNQQSERLLYLSDLLDCYSVDLESPDSVAVQMRFQTEENHVQYTGISRSCNGLVLLFDLEFSIFMANPSTGESRKLPKCPYIVDSESSLRGYGFGYDSSCDDYKVVNISLDGYGYKALENIVSVYNLKLNSWRRITSSSHRLLLFDDRHGVLVNGALHWLGETDVIALDLAGEYFYTVPSIPPYNVNAIESLGVIGDYLCGFDYRFDPSVYFDVWVMKDYGLRESWVRYSVINSPYIVLWPLPSMTGKLLLYTGRKVVSYDLEEGIYKELIVQDIPGDVFVTYEESLIRLLDQCECHVQQTVV